MRRRKRRPAAEQVVMVDNMVPARTRQAFEFALEMSRRACPVVVANDMTIETVQPYPVTAKEKQAWDAACDHLTAYFCGSVDLDEWEESRLDTMTVETDRRRVGNLVVCSACSGEGTIDKEEKEVQCEACDGCGRLIIMPAGHR